MNDLKRCDNCGDWELSIELQPVCYKGNYAKWCLKCDRKRRLKEKEPTAPPRSTKSRGNHKRSACRETPKANTKRNG